MLNLMQKQEIASYIAKTDSPQMQFLQARVDYKNLYIDTQFIAVRKSHKEEQVKAIYGYLDEKVCRSLALQRYFGEEVEEPCGACDLCLVKAHKAGLDESIGKKIQYLLLDSPRTLHALIDAIDMGSEDDRLRVFRQLLDAGTILLKEETYHWNAL
ncbi:RecQ family zinc-binding domain-containing protein, partial [Sphingobacterium lactis]